MNKKDNFGNDLYLNPGFNYFPKSIFKGKDLPLINSIKNFLEKYNLSFKLNEDFKERDYNSIDIIIKKNTDMFNRFDAISYLTKLDNLDHNYFKDLPFKVEKYETEKKINGHKVKDLFSKSIYSIKETKNSKTLINIIFEKI